MKRSTPQNRPSRSNASGSRPARGASGGGRSARGADGPQPMALLAHVYAALQEVLKLEGPADSSLRRHFKAHAKLGRRDRGLIAETVFDVLRNRRLYGHWAQSLLGPLTHRLANLSLARRLDLPALAALGLQEHSEMLQGLVQSPTTGLPPALRLSQPDWLYAGLQESLARAMTPVQSVSAEIDPTPSETTASDSAMSCSAAVDALGSALLEPASLDLRVNLLKSDLETVLKALAQEEIEAWPLPEVPTAIRVRGKPAIERMVAFDDGWFEVQDVGSQALVAFCGVKRGQTVVDFCAGAGGKTLAMAAQMRNRGQIFACDTSMARLTRMKPRLVRSGATNIQPFALESEGDARLGRLAGRADRVLVDAPCSGTGTLRRNPEIKWRLAESDIAELALKQGRILAAAARLVKPGGMLIYATCSLLTAENDAVAQAFAQTHPGFEAAGVMRLLPGLPAHSGTTKGLTVIPDDQNGIPDDEHGIPAARSGFPDDQNAGASASAAAPAAAFTPGPQGDGFFAARWIRKA